jgi:hypothetical protein
MAVRKEKVTVTLAGSAGSASGNVDTPVVLSGKVLAVHIDVGSQPNTLDVTVKATDPELTILTDSDISASDWYYPRAEAQDTAGTALEFGTDLPIPVEIPVDGYINIAGAQGDAGTFVVSLLIDES